MGGGSARAGSEHPPPPRRHRTAAHLLPSHLGVAAPSLIQNVVLLSAPQVELLKQTGASGTETRSAGRCPWAARSGAGSWSVGHQRLRLRGGRAQGRASTSPETTAQGGPAPEGEAGLPRACGPHSAPTRQMQLLLPIREVEPRAQEAQSGCGPDVRTPGVCALRPAEDTRTARAATAEADLRYRRPGSSPAGARGRPRCGRTGREGTAERERPLQDPSLSVAAAPQGHASPGWPQVALGPSSRGLGAGCAKAQRLSGPVGQMLARVTVRSWPSVQRTCSRHTEPTVSSAQAASPRETARS